MADTETRTHMIASMPPGIPTQTVKVPISAIRREALLMIDSAPSRYLVTLNYDSPYQQKSRMSSRIARNSSPLRRNYNTSL
jgi:hypothetical protein